MIYKQTDHIKISDLNVNTDKDIESFIDDVVYFMGEYKDSRHETEESVKKAHQNGFCIEALDKDKIRIGVLVINRSPFDVFQPKFHLSYIAVSGEARDKGVGKMLLQTACLITKNDIALHVGLKNKNARSFYKKMGWEDNYIRMMPSQ
jgi:ribosomal protein S18 acetylase RimI-like enzyme